MTTSVRNPLEEWQGNEVAIVGMAGRFPGASDVESFWSNIKGGVESRSSISEDELRRKGMSEELLSNPKLVKAGFFLDDIALFDAEFFGFRPREAELLDPQHRLILECAWQAMEHAGHVPETFDGPVGLFVSSTMSSYLLNNIVQNSSVIKSTGSAALHGCVPDYLATRIAYKLNLRGPCFAVHSACSSSLVAIHLGCQALQSQEADLVLAGGVAISVPQRRGYLYEEGGILSPEGHVRAFDSRARGTVFGDGVGVVALKRLQDALDEGDTIHAVIRGTAVNNDGGLKAGFTAPSVTGQAEVIAEALANAGVSSDTIGMVEAHGTGTEIGDPIEMAALAAAFGSQRGGGPHCAVGSVKPNVGHLDAAAGISSLIKVIQCLKHRELPPLINYEEANPDIRFDESPFYVNRELKEWESAGKRRRAGVSAFGFGGTNAHVVLEEAPEREESAEARGVQALVLAARSGEAEQEAAQRLGEHLKANPQANLQDVAYTLQVGRQSFRHRRVVLGESVEEATRALDGQEGEVYSGEYDGEARSVVFLFPGQGAQYAGMGEGLYKRYGKYREVVDRCAEALRPKLGLDIRELLCPGEGAERSVLNERLKQTRLAQPALFVVEYALAELWRSLGVTPAASIGHSIGEYVAACVGGVLSEEDALKVVAERGRLMDKMPGGLMVAASLSEQELQQKLGDGVWLSAVNGPSQCVMGGETEKVEALLTRLEAEGVDCRRLHTSHAFHTGMMEEAAQEFEEVMRGVTRGEAKIPYVTNLTGKWATPEQIQDASTWARQLREPVRFNDGLEELLRGEKRVCLEAGPGQVLSTLLRRRPGTEGTQAYNSLPHPGATTGDERTLMGALGKLWIAGASIDWRNLHQGTRRRRIPLPTYPFQRKRFWISPSKSDAAAPAVAAAKRASTQRSSDVADWFYASSWTQASNSFGYGRAADAIPGGSWVVFMDEGGLGRQASDRLRAIGRGVIEVSRGTQASKVDEARYVVRPDAKKDYEEVFAAIQPGLGEPTRVLYLWGITPPGEDPGVDRQFLPLLYLSQALCSSNAPSACLTVVTDGVHEITENEALRPSNAAGLGLCSVIPQEFPSVSCRSIDLDAAAFQRLTTSGVDDLLVDSASSSPDTVIAYRGTRRWLRRFDPIPQSVSGNAPMRLREKGVYLITGGLGEIGLEMAEYLAKTVRAKLVLVSRSGLPPREQWANLQGSSAAVAARIKRVSRLLELGSEVLTPSADVSDEKQLRQAFEAAENQFGAVHGIIHGAGLVDTSGFAGVLDTDATLVRKHFAPKLDGCRSIHAATKGRTLDFVQLVSSLSSFLGGLGYSAYAAANAAIDTYARQAARGNTTPWLVVNWDSWLRAADVVRIDPAALESRYLMKPSEGMECFARILDTDAGSQVAVSTGDLVARINRSVKLTIEKEEGEKVAPVSAPRHPRPNLQTEFVGPQSDTEKKLATIWQELIGLDSVGVRDNFFELGGDSLLGLQVISRVKSDLGATISAVALYEGPTVRSLAALVESCQLPDLQKPSVALNMGRSRGEKRRALKAKS